MELIDSVNNQQKLIEYLCRNVALLFDKPNPDKMKIIFACMHSAEVYFSNQERTGRIKKSVVIEVINKICKIEPEEIHNIIEFICSNNLIGKSNKAIMWLKRHQLKKKLKNL